MSRYRQQVRRAQRDLVQRRVDGRAAQLEPLRQLRPGEKIPADARAGEVFEVIRDAQDGLGERPVARVRVHQGMFGSVVRVIES